MTTQLESRLDAIAPAQAGVHIQVKEVYFSYPGGVQALAGVSLDVPPGGLVAVVGQNGAGKTTLARVLNGLLRPGQGEVWIGDWNTRLYDTSRLAARVGYVFQNPDDQLFCRTVSEEIQFGPRNLKFTPQRLDEFTRHSIELTELTGKEQLNPYDLSPTWRKMVALASILAMDTPVVILDEPTTGQDAVSIRRIGRIIAALHQAGKTVIAITHDIDFCAENFERMVVMGNGKIILDGPLNQVLVEKELLSSTYVEQPQLTRLGQRLGFPQLVATPAEFIQGLHQARNPSVSE